MASEDEDEFDAPSIDPEDLVDEEPDLDEEALGDDGEDGEDGDDDEGDDDEVDPEEAALGAKKKPASKKKAQESEDDPPLHPDAKVPTAKKMRDALAWAFENEEGFDEALLDRYTEHARLLLDKNRQVNLTAIIDPKEVAAKHYLDSWRLTRLLPLMATRVLDLGSGGGFPGMPVALAEPMCSMYLCESIGKKATFLQESVEALGVRHVHVVHERAEDYLARERVDTVIVRAVSSVRENVRTLRKVRHSLKDLVMLKGTSWSREVRAAEREAERLGFKLDTVWEHELPGEMGKRAILVYRAPGGAGQP